MSSFIANGALDRKAVTRYLLRDKLPQNIAAARYGQPEITPSILSKPKTVRIPSEKELLEFNDELKRLNALSDKELRKSYIKALEVSTMIQESGRFFNKPWAKAKFKEWANLSYWSLDEAIALSLGRSPDHVTWKKIEPCVNISSFAKRYELTRRAALRAVETGQLTQNNIPGFFIAWAQRMGHEIDPGLVEAVKSTGTQIADWKTGWDSAQVTISEQAGEIENLKSEIADLKANDYETMMVNQKEVAELPHSMSVDEMDPRSQFTLYMIIHGLASAAPHRWRERQGAGYDSIRNAIDTVTDGKLIRPSSGQCIGDDTLLKALRTAQNAVTAKIKNI